MTIWLIRTIRAESLLNQIGVNLRSIRMDSLRLTLLREWIPMCFIIGMLELILIRIRC